MKRAAVIGSSFFGLFMFVPFYSLDCKEHSFYYNNTNKCLQLSMQLSMEERYGTDYGNSGINGTDGEAEDTGRRSQV